MHFHRNKAYAEISTNNSEDLLGAMYFIYYFNKMQCQCIFLNVDNIF